LTSVAIGKRTGTFAISFTPFTSAENGDDPKADPENLSYLFYPVHFPIVEILA